MSDLAATAEDIEKLTAAAGTVYAVLDGHISDPTKDAECNLALFGRGGNHVLIPLARKTLPAYCSLLAVTAFTADRGVLGWDLKDFYSYCRRHLTPRLYSQMLAPQKFLDLLPAEKYLGLELDTPDDWAEAGARVAGVSEARAFHHRVHVPLLQRTLPAIETAGLIHADSGRSVYPHYDLEGAPNGRLKCQLLYDRTFNPHGLGKDEAAGKLAPRDPHELFLRLDYRAFEVCVLAWLSGDEALAAAVAAGGDIYEPLAVSMGWPDRGIVKTAFLAVLYGQGAAGLAEAAKVPYGVAQDFRLRLLRAFPSACRWLTEREEEAAGGTLTDRFGRRMAVGAAHTARNYSVSSPAAAVALERLNALQLAVGGSARLVGSIHDGYLLTCTKADARDIREFARACLEAESPLAPGLRLRAAASAGYRLNAMRGE